MKHMVLSTFITIFALVSSGCATHTAVTEQIQKESMEQGTVFEELKDGGRTPGFSFLTIRATMKTVKEDFYLLGSKKSLHGKPEYPFVFNIGGQGVIWPAKGIPDIQPDHINGKRNPEGGEGVKYTLEKKIMLKPGSYRVYVGLTEEKLQKKFEITVTAASPGLLEFKPVYLKDRGKGPMFYQGVSDFEVFIDGKKSSPTN